MCRVLVKEINYISVWTNKNLVYNYILFRHSVWSLKMDSRENDRENAAVEIWFWSYFTRALEVFISFSQTQRIID